MYLGSKQCVCIYTQGFFSIMEKSSDKEKVIGVRILYKLASSLAVHNMTSLKSKLVAFV